MTLDTDLARKEEKGGRRRRQSRVFGGALARDFGVFLGICRRRERTRNMAHDAMRTWTLVALRGATEQVKEEAMQAMIVVMSFGVCVAKLRVLQWLGDAANRLLFTLMRISPTKSPFSASHNAAIDSVHLKSDSRLGKSQ